MHVVGASHLPRLLLAAKAANASRGDAKFGLVDQDAKGKFRTVVIKLNNK